MIISCTGIIFFNTVTAKATHVFLNTLSCLIQWLQIQIFYNGKASLPVHSKNLNISISRPPYWAFQQHVLHSVTDRPQHSSGNQDEAQDDKEVNGDISQNLQLSTLDGLDVSPYTDEDQANGGQHKLCCRQQVFPCIHGITTAKTKLPEAQCLPSQFAILCIMVY